MPVVAAGSYGPSTCDGSQARVVDDEVHVRELSRHCHDVIRVIEGRVELYEG